MNANGTVLLAEENRQSAMGAVTVAGTQKLSTAESIPIGALAVETRRKLSCKTKGF